jgi:hypothetical protein
MTTDPFLVAGHIRANLRLIRDHYDDAINPGKINDDSDQRSGATNGEPANLHAMEVRANTVKALVYWVGFIRDEMPTGKGPSTRAIYGTTIDDLGSFIDTWALALAENMPDDADNLSKETHRHGKDLESLSKLWRSRRIQIPGRCPEQTLTVSPEGVEEFRPCTGELWATMREEDKGMLPGRVECSVGVHQWTPWQWRDLGRRIGTSAV